MQRLPAGDLERLELVGSGGFGLVYRGWSKKLNREIALKMIQGSRSSNMKKLMKDLMKERDVMQKACSDTYVLRLLAVYEKPEGSLIEYGLVMEYMPYGSLRTLFDKILNVPWALRFQILHQVALGMNYLHSLDPPIIHRDLKPCNVLLNKHLDVQITDFGLSRIVGATSSVTPSFAGTLSYMAPEALNDINYHPTMSCDVYSYGILLWTMFSGEEPYPGVHDMVIQRGVCEGQRPRLSHVDQYSDVRMVPEAKELMINCWKHKAEDRPSFHDCSKSTAVMFEAYTDEIVNAVRNVQDLLRQISLQDQYSEALGTCEDSSMRMESFIKGLGNALQSDEEKTEVLCSEEAKTEDEELRNDNIASGASSEDDDHDISSSELLMNNVASVIKGSGDYNKIMRNLDNDGILTKDEQEQLNSTQNLKELVNETGKVMARKYKENPTQLVSFFKNLF
ncbi:hypothetical protein GDO81_014645 [Engystomops pustulosus]|uniref:Protein kinase domain-containing protein n=1 Tax=Engystomops pustulosus TaxID=76066 RepID=A0AAV7BBT7_ENGPU|nr:hypothetical protein GDO81_014645 [Engystomops pustulosus]